MPGQKDPTFLRGAAVCVVFPMLVNLIVLATYLIP